MQSEQVATLVAEFAQSSDLVDTFAEIQNDVWGFECGVLDVVLSMNAHQDMLTLETVVEVSVTDRVQLYRKLLSATVSQPFQSIRMALDGTGGNVVQELDTPLATLNETTLNEAVFQFLAQAGTVAELCNENTTSEQSPLIPQTDTIRV